MTFGKIFAVLVVLSLAATGAAMARDISNGTVNGEAEVLAASYIVQTRPSACPP